MAQTSDSNSSSYRWVILSLAVLLIIGLVLGIQAIRNAPDANASAGAPPQGMPPAAVYTQTVTQEVTRDFAVATGTLRAQSRAQVAAREAGAILEMHVDEGDHVQQGDPMVSLDDRKVRALITEAEASLTAAQSLVNQRQAEAARAVEDLAMKRGLLERRAISKSDILDAERALTVAQSQQDAATDGVAQTQSQIDFLKVQLDDHRIRAPFSGVVVERHVEVGEWAAVGTHVITLVATNPVEAWLRIPTRYRNSVSTSPQALQIRQSSTSTLVSPVKVTLVPDVEPLSQLFTAVAELDNKDGQFTAGESITGIVPVGEETPHWKVSVDAILRAVSGDYIFIASPDGTAQRVAVTVAFERDQFAFIPVVGSNLKAGHQVVVEGNERLQPGQALMIRERSEQP